MKLIIQIPCFNEAETIAITIGCLPRQVEGFDTVEWLIIDDGSSDDTAEVARKSGADHIISHTRNLGLARSFSSGLRSCIALGADVILNTDADNQYRAADIPALVKPILNREADIVIGSRPISTIKHFSLVKKLLQYVGSWVVRVASNTNVSDAPCGFRAISREAAMRINIFSGYTYTAEMIIQAGLKDMTIVCVPIKVNFDLRPSRLVKNISSYVKRSIITILRIFIVYQPFKFFMTIATVLLGMGGLVGLRFFYYFVTGEGYGHVQSVILAGILLGAGFQTLLVAFLADIIAVNRQLLEKVDFVLKKAESRIAQGKES